MRITMHGTFFVETSMFLTAVLQAHTDSLSRPNGPIANSRPKDCVTLPARLEKAPTTAPEERTQALPRAHRSRWV